MFDSMFTEAIIIGMTPEQFWDDDPYLYFKYVEAYNKVKETEAKMEVEKTNFAAWLNGFYIDYALKINHPLASKAGEYLKEPINMKNEEIENESKYTEEELAKFEEQKMLRQFEQFGKYSEAYNKQYFGVEEGE